MSATDRTLIAALRADARLSITELAERAGVSRATARARLDALMAEGRIRRFTIETDTDLDGAVRAITLIELQGSMSRKVIRALSNIAEVWRIHSTNGAWDLVVEVRTETLPDFDRVLREIREVPGVLNSQSSILLSRVSG
ncbi:Lrp/AsnC family transcriptional regulator [Vannielia litorea]|uniref:Lrp/AsnC family transcriptional regulator n=1 Tax=Vannielia litorea TaxID=1217970 RepID=UPI001FE2F02D|nr:Lrp/AsnC family transcriptional regulator [Vannielia litorea]